MSHQHAVACRLLSPEEIKEALAVGAITPIQNIRSTSGGYTCPTRKFEAGSCADRRVRWN